MHCPHCEVYAEAAGPVVGRYIALACLNCKGAVIVGVESGRPLEKISSDDVLDYHPKKRITADPLLPPDIAQDYVEAQRDFSVAAWASCAVMVRRCVHGVLEHLGASPQDDLYDQIAKLVPTKLTEPLARLARRVAVLGRDGAHPYDRKSGTAFPKVAMADAQTALDFCDHLFSHVFILPAKIAESEKEHPSKLP